MSDDEGNARTAPPSPVDNADLQLAPESDDDAGLPDLNSGPGSKLRDIIQHINADSDDDDDDDPSDPPVDFGEEEEEEEDPVEELHQHTEHVQQEDTIVPVDVTSPPSSEKENRSSQEKPSQGKSSQGKSSQGKSSQGKSSQGKSSQGKSSQGKESKPLKQVKQLVVPEAAKKKQTKGLKKKASSPPLVKPRSKSTPTKGATKTIKKTPLPKSNTGPSKKATTGKNAGALLKNIPKGSSPQKTKDTDKKPAKAAKKVVAKTAPKKGTKSSPGSTKKAQPKETAENGKALKVKKTIDKAAKQSDKKALAKKKSKAAVDAKTSSKKTTSTSEVGNQPKASFSKKKNSAKTEVKAKAKAKAKPAKKERCKAKEGEVVGSDDEDMVDGEGDSEGEVWLDSSDSEDEELTHTPSAKLPIIGSLACSSRDANTQALLDHAVQQLGKYRVVSYGPDSDSLLSGYIIGKETKRGWGLLQALASGCPLVSDDWLSKSISEGCWQTMDVYQSDRFGKSPRSVCSTEGPLRILEGLRIRVACDGADASSVRRVATLCGGRVAETRVNLVINDIGTKVDACTNVAKKWLADSIEAGMAVEYYPYLVDSAG